MKGKSCTSKTARPQTLATSTLDECDDKTEMVLVQTGFEDAASRDGHRDGCGEAAAQFYCHCDDCQATSGGAYVAIAIYAADAVSQTKGELDTWTL